MIESKGYDPVRDHSGTCAKCGEVDTISRRPGKIPHCYRCGTYQLWMGKIREAPCVDGGGSAYSHMQYVKGFGPGIKSVCAFCGRTYDEPLPEWPEIEEEDLEVTTSNKMPGQPLEIRILHKPTGIKVGCRIFKSALKSKAWALRALREKLKSIPIGAYECPSP